MVQLIGEVTEETFLNSRACYVARQRHDRLKSKPKLETAIK